MSNDSLAEPGLQSGVVLAVLIASVLLANHLGGSAGLAQRAAQVGLGVVLMMLVFSATTAFHGPSTIPATALETLFESEQQLTGLSNESAQRNSEVGTIHIGLGIVFVALGVVLFHRLSTITPAFLLGGVLLILLGAPAGGEGTNPLNALFSAVVPGGFGDDAGNARDIARFVVLLVGAMLLAGLMYFRWERESSGDAVEASDS